jgi:hypothetical protein
MFEFCWLLLRLVYWLASLTATGWWAYGSAFVVFVGVVGESIAALTNWIRPEDRAKRLEKASALVLILGLAGDLVSIHMTEIATASLNEEAANARRDAGNAELTANSANSLAQGAALEAGKARERAVRAELELAKYKAPRSLTPKQQAIIVSKLKRFAGTRANMLAYSSDDEIVGISRQIANALRSDGAGWNVRLVTANDFDRTVSGILVEIDQGVAAEVSSPFRNTFWVDAAKIQGAAKSLVEALNSAGVRTNGPEPTMILGVRGTPGLFRSPEQSLQQFALDDAAKIKITIGRKPQ